MVFPRSLVLVVLVLVTSAACGGDDGTAPDVTTVADLVGSWTATSQVFSNNANSAETFDWIGNGGETRVTVLTGGRSRTWTSIGTFSDEWDAQLSISGAVLTSTPAESTRPVERFTFSLNGDVLTLTNASTAFDFTLTGAATVPATVSLVLQRN
jgi:hypothetical protein